MNYLICSSPRTGSYLLAEALQNSGLAGAPSEFFDPEYEDLFKQMWSIPQASDYVEYLRTLQERTHTQNGAFGAKVHWPQFVKFFGLARATPGYEELTDEAILDRLLPGARFVWLSRGDKLRQAISYSKAIQSDTWWHIEGLEEPALREPQFRFDHVRWLLGLLEQQDASWDAYFRARGVRPLRLFYEKMIGDLEGTACAVLEYLGIEAGAHPTIAPPRLRKQSDVASEEWVRRYQLCARAARENYAALHGLGFLNVVP